MSEEKTEHLYEGNPDTRQGDAATIPSRFHPKYRTLTPAEKELHDKIKEKAFELELLFDMVKPSRYNSLAMTSLEESIMWIIKGITS